MMKRQIALSLGISSIVLGLALLLDRPIFDAIYWFINVVIPQFGSSPMWFKGFTMVLIGALITACAFPYERRK